MTDRRYSEDEVAEIFKRAAESQQTARRQLPAGEGMTLADLQGIGQEVGIPAELVAQAATSLERGGQPTGRRFLGVSVGVGRTVELPRQLTDAEWDQLVVDLRETFDARGSVRVEGSLRQWTNGNLQALLEPTPSGARLRLRTLNGNARSQMMLGLAGLGGAAAVGIVAVSAGTLAESAGVLGPMALFGAAMVSLGVLRLPRWSRNRARQMEGIAARLSLVTKAPMPPALPGPSDEV